jgi:hypothetical protein
MARANPPGGARIPCATSPAPMRRAVTTRDQAAGEIPISSSSGHSLRIAASGSR